MRYLLVLIAFIPLHALFSETSESSQNQSELLEYHKALRSAAVKSLDNFTDNNISSWFKKEWFDQLESGEISEDDIIRMANEGTVFKKESRLCALNQDDLNRTRAIYSSQQKSFDDENLNRLLSDAFLYYRLELERRKCLEELGWDRFTG